MSGRNTFVTKFIYGRDKFDKIKAILSTNTDSSHWHGKQDGTAGYFTGIVGTVGDPPYMAVLMILKDTRQHCPDFDMAMVCDDWPDVISAASLTEMGFSLD